MASSEANNTPASDSNEEQNETCAKCEPTLTEIERKANQLRKERNAERILNQKLQKNIDKLSNQLLRGQTRVATLEREVKYLQDNIKDKEPEVCDGVPSNTDEKALEKLTSKIRELKISLERYNEEQQSQSDDDDEGWNRMIALTILFHSLQSYLELESDQGNLTDDRNVMDSMEVLLEGLKRQRDKSIPATQHISRSFTILVYLAPILLSALCFMLFTNTVKK